MTAKMSVTENSLAVQWLGLQGQSSIAGDTGLISGWGTKIPQGLAKIIKKDVGNKRKKNWTISEL